MRKYIWMLPVVLLAGCSKSPSSNPAAANAPNYVAPANPAQEQAELIRVIPAGTALHVRLDEALDTRRNRPGDAFRATLEEPVVLDGGTVVPRGTRLTGHVTTAAPSGRFKGRAVLALTLDSFEAGGRAYHVRTDHIERVSAAHKKRDVALIGGGAGLGAVVGALAGGGKGAAIGALAGGGAGTAGAALTGKKEVGVNAESMLTFRLTAPVEM